MIRFEILDEEFRRRDEEVFIRAAAQERLRCPCCGRFAKLGRPPRMDVNGEYPFSVHCSVHGEVWIV